MGTAVDNQTKNRIPRIERIERKYSPDAWLDIPTGDGMRRFAYPFFKGGYRGVGKQIIDAGLRVPTGEETVDFVHAAYCVLEVHAASEFKNVRKVMRNGCLPVYV